MLDTAATQSALSAAQEERSVPQTGGLVARFGPAVAQEPMLQSDMPACIASVSNFGTHAPAGVRAGGKGSAAETARAPDRPTCATHMAKGAADLGKCFPDMAA